jgi:C4-type Zn-finger protein
LGSNNPFVDSDPEFAGKMSNVLEELSRMREGLRPFKLILTDPLAHSFLANPWHPEADKRATIEFRKRT